MTSGQLVHADSWVRQIYKSGVGDNPTPFCCDADWMVTVDLIDLIGR